MTAYLFDASGILTAIRLGKGEMLIGNYTLLLARYELGNAILKEGTIHHKYTKQQQFEFIGIIDGALKSMRVLDVEDIAKNVLDVALSYKLSFYDACYAYYARYTGMTLVTEDAKLANKVRGYIKTVGAEQA